MAVEDRRARERAHRRQLILGAARGLAEAEGWEAVTTRRLSALIEYSQPVLYKHFSGMEEIARAVAVQGFAELAQALRTAREGAGSPREALHGTAHAYLDFARANPALYEAMFLRPTSLPSAVGTPPELVAAFTEIRTTVASFDAAGDDGDAALSEVLWAALHGLATLTMGARLRPDEHDRRVALLVDRFAGMADPARAS